MGGEQGFCVEVGRRLQSVNHHVWSILCVCVSCIVCLRGHQGAALPEQDEGGPEGLPAKQSFALTHSGVTSVDHVAAPH